jgi:hypothetical protein
MGEKKNAYRLLMGKPEGKRPLEIPRRRWVDTVRMDLLGLGCSDEDWISLAQDRERWRALAGKRLSVLTIGVLSSGAQLHRVS